MRTIVGEFCPPRRPSRTAWVTLAALAVCSAAVWLLAALQALEARALRVEAAQLEALAAEAQRASSVAAPAPAPWDASARAMLVQALAPWPRALTALEAARIQGVTPLGITINVPAQSVLVELQFSDYPPLLEYIGQLNAAEPSLRWRLVHAQSDTKSGTAALPGAVQGASRATVAASLGR